LRDTFGNVLYEEACKNPEIFVVCADISPVGSMQRFREEFPDRFINVGVAEQSMIGICAGLALRGCRPFAYTIAAFALFRPFEFIRSDIGGQNLPVCIVGMGAGAYQDHGLTHFTGEDDITIANTIPNIKVLQPKDLDEVVLYTRWCCRRPLPFPTYLRLLRL
jgi:transketolase